jgi:uncharacterized DUF497 family protein
VEIEFDPEKRDDILLHRGLDLATAGKLLTGECLTEADDRFDYGKDRWISVGPLEGESSPASGLIGARKSYGL